MTFEEFIKNKPNITNLEKLDYIHKFKFDGRSLYNDYIALINKKNEFIIIECYYAINKFRGTEQNFHFLTALNLEEKDVKSFEKNKTDKEKENWFYQNINQKLDDPFIQDKKDLQNEKLSFKKGNQEEFFNILKNIIWQDQTITEYPFYIGISSKTEYKDSHIKESDEMSEKTCKILLKLIKEYQPSGFLWKYNGGPSNLKSGYSYKPHYLEYEIEEPTSHQRIDSRIKIKELTKNEF